LRTHKLSKSLSHLHPNNLYNSDSISLDSRRCLVYTSWVSVSALLSQRRPQSSALSAEKLRLWATSKVGIMTGVRVATGRVLSIKTRSESLPNQEIIPAYPCALRCRRVPAFTGLQTFRLFKGLGLGKYGGEQNRQSVVPTNVITSTGITAAPERYVVIECVFQDASRNGKNF
jgi:hypothetical protein